MPNRKSMKEKKIFLNTKERMKRKKKKARVFPSIAPKGLEGQRPKRKT
jgi:hypothetical protein